MRKVSLSKHCLHSLLCYASDMVLLTLVTRLFPVAGQVATQTTMIPRGRLVYTSLCALNLKSNLRPSHLVNTSACVLLGGLSAYPVFHIAKYGDSLRLDLLTKRAVPRIQKPIQLVHQPLGGDALSALNLEVPACTGARDQHRESRMRLRTPANDCSG